DRLEPTGSVDVVQYRGGVLPIVALAEYLGLPHDFAGEPIVALVVAFDGREVGLRVRAIVEVSTAHSVDGGGQSAALRTSTVDGRVVDLVDLDALTVLAAGDTASTPTSAVAA